MQTRLLSVVMPVSGDGHRIPGSLARLAQQLDSAGVDPGCFEVIIVDDASAALSAIRINEALRKFTESQLIRLPWTCGPGTALRAGVAAATSDYIAVIGPDQRLDGVWLAAVVRLLADADLLLTPAVPAHPATGPNALPPTLSRRFSEMACTQFASRLGTPPFVGGQRLAALRTEIAKPMFALLRSPGVAFDVEAHVVAASMGLRIGRIAPPSFPASGEHGLPHPTPSPRVGAVLSGLLRARRHRSRALKSNGMAELSQFPRRSDDTDLIIDLTDVPAVGWSPTRTKATT